MGVTRPTSSVAMGATRPRSSAVLDTSGCAAGIGGSSSTLCVSAMAIPYSFSLSSAAQTDHYRESAGQVDEERNPYRHQATTYHSRQSAGRRGSGRFHPRPHFGARARQSKTVLYEG